MAVALEKIIRITAQTRGQEGIAQMDRVIRRLGPGAEASVVGVLRLNRVMGDMGTIAGGIGLAGLGASLLAFGRNSVQAGDDSLLVARRMATLGDQSGETGRMMDFARASAEKFSTGQLETSQAVADLYARLRPMGVSLADIETTFNGVNKAARLAGLSASDQTEAFTQLAQAMGSGRLQGDELRSLMERMPQIGNAIVKVFNDIAASKGLEQITKQRAAVLIEEVKNGEKQQTQALKDEMRKRQELAERETNELLKAIGRRYDEMARQLDRNFQDRDEEETKAIDKRLRTQKEGIDKEYDQQRTNIERMYEDRLDAIEQDKALNDDVKKELRRALEDERNAELEVMEKRQQAKLENLDEISREESKQRARASEDEKRQHEQRLRDQQQAEEDSLRQSLEARQKTMEADLQKTLDTNKKANEDMIAAILARVKVTQGDLKQMGADGLITTEIMIKAMKELEKLQPPKATALQEFDTAIKDLSTSVGEDLLPALTPLIQGLTSLVDSFSKLPQPIQTVIIGITGLGLAISALKFAGILGGIGSLIGLLGKLGMAISGTKLAATIAGSAGVIVPAFTTALTGLITWMATTFVPAMVAFFSGPAGWIALGVAALIAGIVIFREPIGKFLSWIFEKIAEFWKGVWDFIYGTQIKPWVDLWNKLLKDPILRFFNFVTTWFNDLWNKIKTPLSNAMQNILYLIAAPFQAIWKALDDAVFKPLGNWLGGLWEKVSGYLSGLWTGISDWFADLGQFLSTALNLAWEGLIKTAYTLFIDPWVQLWEKIKKPASDLVEFLGTFLDETWKLIVTIAYELFVQPWVNLWNKIKKPAVDLVKYLDTFLDLTWKAITDNANKIFIEPWKELWKKITKEPEDFKNSVNTWFTELRINIVRSWEGVSANLQRIWDNVTRYVGNGWRQMMDGIKNVLNDAIKLWNFVASKTQGLPKFAQLPLIPQIGTPPESFARGGFVSKPTLSMLGDGANPNEYAIPENRMPAAVAGWQAGLRGQALVNAWQSSGLAPGSSLPAATMAGGGGGGFGGGASIGGGDVGPIQITVTGGTVTLPDGREMVTLEQAQEIALRTVRAAAPSLVRALVHATGQLQRSAAGRASYGLS